MNNRNPARLLADPPALSDPSALPVAHARVSTVFRAEKGGRTFNLHSYLSRYKDRFWACWSSGLTHEDRPGQQVSYATSRDGQEWSKPGVLAAPEDTTDGSGTCISRGLYVDGGQLYGLVAALDRLKPGVGWEGLRLKRYQWNGTEWDDLGVLIDDAMTNYPPRRIDGRLFMTRRVGDRDQFYTALSEDGVHWDLTRMPGDNSRCSEPSWYVDPQGTVHMILRDASKSRRLMRSLSTDHGRTWSEPVETDYPDATSKNFTLRTQGRVYLLINNPDPDGRDPLACSFSKDGWTFDHPIALRAKSPDRRFEGKAKPLKSFQYPHAVEHAGSLFVIYATNKEDIEVAEYALDDLIPRSLQ